MAATKAVRQAAEHGRHIFIYNNIRTNQTVYSLQRSLNNHHALSQLPYAGKKTVPAKLRKDVWRPLATVTFPIPAQGLSVYRKLREFRKLHELHWDNNPEYPMLPPETQKKLKEGKAAPTKKEKGKIIMDQKANTVADLAAVLKMQDEEGATQFEAAVKQFRKALKQLEDAAERSKQGGVEEIRAKIAEKEAQLQGTSLSGDQVKAVRKQILGLHFQKNKLLRAEEELEKKRSEGRLWELAMKARNGAVEKLQAEILDAQDSLDTKKDLSEGGKAYLEERVETLTKERDEIIEANEVIKSKLAGNAEPATMQLPKYGLRRKKMLDRHKPKLPFTAEGVRIRWADILDAEYAESWPEKVQHEALGLARHTAPDPAIPPHTWPKDFKQRDVYGTEGVEEEIAQDVETATEGSKATATA